MRRRMDANPRFARWRLRYTAAVGVALAIGAVFWVVAASANTISIGPASMEGAIKVSPGEWINAGFRFKYHGSHPQSTVAFQGATFTFAAKCVGSGTSVSLQIAAPDETFLVTANDTGHEPTNDHDSAASFQAAARYGVDTPDLCGGGDIDLRRGATFTAEVKSSDTSDAIAVQFHYRSAAAKNKGNVNCADPAQNPDPGSPSVCGASWSPTATVVPDALQQQPALTTSAQAGGPIGVSGTFDLRDTATLSNGTSDAAGTLTFHLFGDDGSGGCGTEVGGPVDLVVAGADGKSYSSPPITVFGAGTYHWRVSYSGDANNFAVPLTACGDPGEDVFISRRAPSIVTSLSANQIEAGGSASDSATLSGATGNAGGTVAYTVYSDAACTQSPRDAGTFSVTNGSVPSSNSLTFGSGGTFHWQAAYSGDANNAPATSDCASEVLSVVNLTVTKVADSPLVSAGGQAGFAVTVSGSGPAAGVKLNDPLPLGGSGSGVDWSIAGQGGKPIGCTIDKSAPSRQVLRCGEPGGIALDGESFSVHLTSPTSPSAATFELPNSGCARAGNHSQVCSAAKITVVGKCVLGYPDSSHTPRSSAVFNESTVLRAFSVFGSGLGTQIAAWYSDEHALTLGVNPFTPPVTTMTTNPDHATNPSIGDRSALDGAGRPEYPALFVTDITDHANDRSGDWEQGNDTAFSPSDVFGTWKAATRSGTSITPGSDPARNSSFGAGADTPPAGISYEKYRTEVRWNAGDLGLLSHHAYRLLFLVHDGDQNKTGGDVGQACANVIIP
jgi:hypothetical protein